MMDTDELSHRLHRLESIEAITKLKARYFRACDAKQIDVVRDCFVDGEVVIDYGAIGCFTHRDQLVETYTKMACNDHVHDLHLGGNPQIELTGYDTASGTWTLLFFQVNTATQAVIQMGSTYQDTYCCIDGAWRIATSRSSPHVTELMKLQEGLHQIEFAGRAMQSFGVLDSGD